ncbi:MAG: hypothetical protein ACLFR1_07615 [Spirochaetia bacterium]
MADIDKLNKRERTFLAGALKTLIMADGKISEDELKDMDHINKELGFSDFDKSLEDFEAQIHDRESFWEYAEAITDSEIQDIILKALNELALQGGYSTETEDSIINSLDEMWNKV